MIFSLQIKYYTISIIYLSLLRILLVNVYRYKIKIAGFIEIRLKTTPDHLSFYVTSINDVLY